MKTLEQLNGGVECLREDEIINLEGGYRQPTDEELGIREGDTRNPIKILILTTIICW